MGSKRHPADFSYIFALKKAIAAHEKINDQPNAPVF
jgi:hypothetical protein